MKFFLVMIVYCFAFTVSPARAQVLEDVPRNEDAPAANPCFPVLPLIKTAAGGELAWRPEWALHIPPDAFTIRSGKVSSINIKTDTGNYTCEWDSSGRLVTFPALTGLPLTEEEYPGTVSVRFNKSGEAVNLEISGGSPVQVEIIEMKDGEPALARINRDGEYFFVVFHSWNNFVSETWYTADGSAQGLLTAEYIRLNKKSVIIMEESISGAYSQKITYDYDSWGNISQVNAGGLVISALYNRNAWPRYVERRYTPIPGDEALSSGEESAPTREHRSYQWDERDLLVSLKGSLEDQVAEILYEYSFDSRGNWTERREVKMIRRDGYLFPSPGVAVQRDIEYLTP